MRLRVREPSELHSLKTVAWAGVTAGCMDALANPHLGTTTDILAPVVAIMLVRYWRTAVAALTFGATYGIIAAGYPVLDRWLSPPWFSFFGFDFYVTTGLARFVVFLLMPPLVFLLTQIIHGKMIVGSGLCKSCAYDLTGNNSGQCPECGRRVTTIPCGPVKCP